MINRDRRAIKQRVGGTHLVSECDAVISKVLHEDRFIRVCDVEEIGCDHLAVGLFDEIGQAGDLTGGSNEKYVAIDKSIDVLYNGVIINFCFEYDVIKY